MRPRERQCGQYKGGEIDFRGPTVFGQFPFRHAPAISASGTSRGAGMIANVCLTNTGIVKLYNCYLLKFTPQINIEKYIIETSLH